MLIKKMTVPVVETEKDLRVTRSNNLDFTNHINSCPQGSMNSCISKENSMIAWV